MDKLPKSISQQLVAVAVVSLLFVFFSLFFLHKHDNIDFDFGKQLRSGQFIVQHKQVINSNDFSFADTDLKSINSQWGSSIVFYYVHSMGGLSSLTVLALLLNIVSFFLIFKVSVQRNNYWLVIFTSLLVLPLLTFSTSPNPEMFSLLFFAISIFLIFNCAFSNSKRAYWWVLPIIQLLWVNFDSLFFIGLFLQLLLLLHLIINRRGRKNIITFLIIFVVSIIACFFNPYGIDGVLLPLKSLIEINPQNENLHFLFLYNRLGDSLYFFYFEFLFFLAALLLYYWLKNRKLLKPNFLIIALFITSVLLVFWRINTAMYFGYVFIIMASFIGKQFNIKMLKRTSIVFTGLLLVSIIVFRIYFYLPYKTVNPGTGIENKLSGGANYFLKHQLHGPIFNTPEMGAYLTYYLYPKERVFVDKSAYVGEFMGDVLLPGLKDQKRWLDLDNKYNFNVVYLNYDTQAKGFTKRLFKDSSWFLAYYDEYSLIFLKRNKKNDPFVRSELLNKITLTKIMFRFNANEFQLPYWQNIDKLERSND